MKRRICVGVDLDTCVTIDIDLDVMTTERAAEINEFFIDSAMRLLEHDGDPIRAVAAMAARVLLHALIDGVPREFAVELLAEGEGWIAPLGIEIVDWSTPDLDEMTIFEDSGHG